MPSWGNTDSIYDKPHWPEERQVRPFITLTTNGAVSTGNTIVFTGTDSLTAANLGVVAGMSAYAANVSITGEQEFFIANNTVRSVTGNSVVLTANVFGNVPSGTTIQFAYPIQYNQNTANTYFADTVLVSNTRIANATFGGTVNHATAHTGWVHVVTGTGGRSGRVQAEVLVALNTATAANTLSGNTSNSQTYYAGL